MALTAEKVAAWFRSLTKRELRNNPAIKEAGRAMQRLQRVHRGGRGRVPTVQHKGPVKPDDWHDWPQADKIAWTRKYGACRCVGCRKKGDHMKQKASFPAREPRESAKGSKPQHDPPRKPLVPPLKKKADK